jgi:hypothetical protein
MSSGPLRGIDPSAWPAPLRTFCPHTPSAAIGACPGCHQVVPDGCGCCAPPGLMGHASEMDMEGMPGGCYRVRTAGVRTEEARMRYKIGAEQLERVPSLAHRPNGIFRAARTAPVGPTHAVDAATGLVACGRLSPASWNLRWRSPA